MEYSERTAIRDFVLDYLIEDGGVFDPYAHCEYTCDLTLWYERIVKEAA